MNEVTATISVKCKVAGINLTRPQKEIYQFFQKAEVTTQIIDIDEYNMRMGIAMFIIQYGFDYF